MGQGVRPLAASHARLSTLSGIRRRRRDSRATEGKAQGSQGFSLWTAAIRDTGFLRRHGACRGSPKPAGLAARPDLPRVAIGVRLRRALLVPPCTN